MSKKKKNQIGELKQEIDILDHMLDALVETLEEKGILTQSEYENRVRRKSERAKGLSSYRDIQFKKK